MTESYAGGSRNLLVGSPIPDRSKGRGQTVVWSPMLGVGRGASDSTTKNLLLRNRGGGQDSHRIVAPVNNSNNNNKSQVLSLYTYQTENIEI
jgi:hypothetical protein